MLPEVWRQSHMIRSMKIITSILMGDFEAFGWWDYFFPCFWSFQSNVETRHPYTPSWNRWKGVTDTSRVSDNNHENIDSIEDLQTYPESQPQSTLTKNSHPPQQEQEADGQCSEESTNPGGQERPLLHHAPSLHSKQFRLFWRGGGGGNEGNFNELYWRKGTNHEKNNQKLQTENKKNKQ